VNGIAPVSQHKKKVQTKGGWQKFQQRRQRRYDPHFLEEDPWKRKSQAAYPSIVNKTSRSEVGAFTEHDIEPTHQNIPGAFRLQFSAPIVFFLKDKLPVPRFSSGVKFDAGVSRRLLWDTITNSCAETEDKFCTSIEFKWLDDPATILDRLESGELSESGERTAIAHAERLAFPGSQKKRLLALYEALIEESRYSEDDEEITTICSAIRKYVMNMGSERFARYASWLVPSASERVHYDVELELTKGAYWHLPYLSTTPDENLRCLQTVLADEACDYLKPRLMLDKNYASIAKFSILACVLIDARQDDSEVSRRIWSQKSLLSMNWFDRLVKFELGKAVKSIESRDEEFSVKVTELLETLDREGE